MAKRKRIGIVFDDFGGLWTGGTYYILNLIKALKLLPQETLPELVIFSNQENEFKMIEETGYPFLLRCYNIEKFKIEPAYTFLERIINKGSRILFKKNLIDKRPDRSDLLFLFPILDPLFHKLPGLPHYHPYFLERIPKVYWIPDFQEHYLPQFFNQVDIDYRKSFQKKISQEKTTIVFSSKDAENDFKKFYPGSVAKTFVLNFAVSHPDYHHIDWQNIKDKYDLNKPYFFSPNQFWKHKNQIVILEAIKLLQPDNDDILIVFSGKETDLRNPDYINFLKDFIRENKLEKNVRFLGFIDRLEQLQIMENSIAVVQPSLFEGWSTVVEDAKAMNKYVIASDLNVHQEQLQQNRSFFKRNSPSELARVLNSLVENRPKINAINYNSNQKKFAEDLMRLLKENNV